ncbi:FAD binding domain-containing protein [Gamsiella multidivaricata]|uniref:FAD binding domain-containing protein n=1 Tax=Gamsiella multidivaricata TaxID=101098 RepID=UPI00221F90AC|nr:FAD binding domain-containing protein [Gamsiella multidivaricata]KAG0365895.1 hypothetical protein BGZ54_006076 [Gamsiella multidivaricata]KAI7822638.1 FAD binding domain-containing protein [Gamsiella multidivaricata]
MPSNMTSSNTPDHVDVPVLISGAGPAGLFAAILLTKLNVPCRIIERQLEVSPLSKALVIHARTMEIFAITGILNSFLDRGQRLTDFHAYIGSKLTAVLPALSNKESHYSFGLFLEQLHTTATLTEELEALGIKVDRGWELMDTKVVEEGGKSWVETMIRRAIVGTNVRRTESKVLGVVEEDPEEEGKRYETQVVKSEYMIATDGGKSVVRHKLNIGFPGRTLDNNMILYDGHIESDLPLNDHISVIQGANNHTMFVFPLHNGQVRIMVDNGTLTPEQHAALKPEDLTLEKFEALAAACVAPAKFKCLDSTWLTYYRVNERRAEHFTYKNRIFLAGDASHVHSPAGGQGMNTGLQDSFNLTWKLALVLHGIAPENIMDTYEAERKPVADGIIKLSARLLEVGLAQDFVRRTLKKIAFTIGPYILPYIPGTNPVNMLAIRYHENAINQRSKSQASVDEDFQVGQRARDGCLRVISKQDMGLPASEGESVRLHELLVGPGIFHVIVFASDMLPSIANGQPTAKSTIKGVETMDAYELAKEVKQHLNSWRSRWAYKPASKIAGQGDLVLPASISGGSSTTTSPNASLAAIPHARNPSTLFMVHVVAAESSSTSGDNTSMEFNLDILTENKAGEGKVYLDQQGLLHQKYGVLVEHGPGAIVVVRPDSHIGYRVLGANKAAWDEIDLYLESILVKQKSTDEIENDK